MTCRDKTNRPRLRAGRAHWTALAAAAGAAFAIAITAPGPVPEAAAEPPEPSPAETAHDAADVVSQASDAIKTATSWLSDTIQSVSKRVQDKAVPVPAPTGIRIAQIATPAADETSPDPKAVGAVQWIAAAEVDPLPDRLVLLVHGLDEPGTIWDEMTPALLAEGLDVARFEYPNDQPIADSTDLMAEALRELAARGVTRVDLVAHSMGGLVSRDLLTREEHYGGKADAHDGLPDIRRLITIGTPHEGSPWATLQIVSETREQLLRWFENGGGGLFDFSHDGSGEAAEDLKPGSEFLTELNSREAPEGVEITCIRATMAPEEVGVLKDVLRWPISRQFLTAEQIQDLEEGGDELLKLLGDGVVPHDSAVLEGAEVVDVEGNHRSVLLRGFLNDARKAIGKEEKVAPSIPVVIERLVEREETDEAVGETPSP